MRPCWTRRSGPPSVPTAGRSPRTAWRLLGQCAGCPSADLTNETIVEAELTAALPDLVRKVAVIRTVSDELWEQAKRLLRDHHL